MVDAAIHKGCKYGLFRQRAHSNDEEKRQMAKGQMTEAPKAHYMERYAERDAQEIGARTGLRFDESEGLFALSLVGTQYYVKHPVFEAPGLRPYEEILLLRYMLEGTFVPASGGMLAYSEMPWGAVYQTQFQGRVLGRIAREFGSDPSLLERAVCGIPGLRRELIDGAYAAYRVEFLDGFFISILVWMGDEEFPASSQLLFSDNFKYAFTAEDIAVIGDIIIGRLKQSLKAQEASGGFPV